MTAAPPNANENHPRWQAGVLCVVAGYADTVGFLKFGAFAGLMTGNTVFLGIALAQLDWSEALRSITIIGAFLAGIVIAVVLKRLGIPLIAIVGLEAAALVAASFLEKDVAAPTLALAMGVQNAAISRFMSVTLNTVFLTGDLQKLVTTAVARLGGRDSGQPERPELVVFAWVYGGYLAGAILGAVAHEFLTRPLLLAPFLLATVLIRRTS